jgi:hypothetical protein
MSNIANFHDIEKEVLKLPLEEQLELIEKITHKMRKSETHNFGKKLNNQLELIAEKLRDHYLTDKDLTAFTSLDSEDFNAEG